MSYGKAQAEWVRIHKIGYGSLVKVTRTKLRDDEIKYAKRFADRLSDLKRNVVYKVHGVYDLSYGTNHTYIEIRPINNRYYEAWGVPFFLLKPA